MSHWYPNTFTNVEKQVNIDYMLVPWGKQNEGKLISSKNDTGV